MIASTRNIPGDAEKQAYLKSIEARLAEKRATLRYIKRKINTATESHRIQVSEQLLKAQLHADSSIEALQTKLTVLGTADEQLWPGGRIEVEVAWDELVQAIKKVVARFP